MSKPPPAHPFRRHTPSGKDNPLGLLSGPNHPLQRGIAQALLLGLTISLGACSEPAEPPPQQPVAPLQLEAPQLLPPPPQDTTPTLPAQPQFKLGFAVETPTPVFSDSTLTTLYGHLPAGARVSVFAQQGGVTEIRISKDGTLYKAWTKTADVLLGNEAYAKVVIEQRVCQKGVYRPAHEEWLSGLMAVAKAQEVADTQAENDLDPEFGVGEYTEETENADGEIEEVETGEQQDLYAQMMDRNPKMAGAPKPKPLTPKYSVKLIVEAPQSADAYVKVKNMDRQEVLGFYVHAGKSATVMIPEGEHEMYFMTGTRFSKTCGNFLEGLQIQKDPTPVKLSRGEGITYGLQLREGNPLFGGSFQPKSVSAEEFK